MSDSVRPHRRPPTRLLCPWDSPGKNTGVGCHFLLQCMKVKSESEVAQSCPTLRTPWTAAYQAPPSMGFSREEYWSGVPLPSPFTSLIHNKWNAFGALLWSKYKNIKQKPPNTYLKWIFCNFKPFWFFSQSFIISSVLIKYQPLTGRNC